MDIKCRRCGLYFPVKPYRKDVAIYCSYDCYWERSQDKSEKKCSVCAKTLPISWFQKINRGWESRCRLCKNKEFKNWSRRNMTYQRFRFYEYRSKKAGRPFTITMEYFENLIKDGKCYYCGDSDKRLGLDRIDSKGGYIEGNVVGSCRYCNVAKNDQTTDAFLEMCAKITRKHAATRSTNSDSVGPT